MADQLFATKGARPKYNYVDVINSMTPYLPQKYQVAQNQQMAQDQFKFEQEMFDEQMNLENKKFKTQKQDTNMANMIGAGKLGIDALLAYDAFSKSDPTKGVQTPGVLDKVMNVFKTPEVNNANTNVSGLTGGEGVFSQGTNLLQNAGGAAIDGTGNMARELFDAGDENIIQPIKKVVEGGSNWVGDLYNTAVGSLFGGGQNNNNDFDISSWF